MMRRYLKQSMLRLAAILPLERFMMKKDAVYVLSLHGVEERYNPFYPSIHPSDFEWMLERLGKVCDFVSLSDLSPTAVKSRNKPRVVLSFDDGYANFRDYAWAIMQSKGIPCNLNIVGSCVRTGKPPWTVSISEFLMKAPRQFFEETRLRFGFSIDSSATDDAKQIFAAKLTNRMKMRSIAENVEDMNWITRWQEQFPASANRTLGLHELKSLPSDVAIGNHSDSHTSMQFETLDYFRNDFMMCDRIVQELTGRPTEIYAFPNGSWRADQIDWLTERNCKHILLVEERPLGSIWAVKSRITCAGTGRGAIRLRMTGMRGKSPWNESVYRSLVNR